MRMTKSFGRTLRERPSDAEMVSHELMLRAGLIVKVAAGIYDYMPMAWRAVKKIEDIMRKEMDAIDGQEINMPVVHPADIWKESGRWYDIGPEMVRFKDRSGRDMCLAMTHEETVTDLVRRYVDSYRQLPLVLYHIQTKFRDEPRARGGLVRVREFIMKDAYSFHEDLEDLERYYPSMCRAYERICQTCGVPVVKVLSDVGMMGGNLAHEFTYLTDAGEDTLILCPQCGYAANREVARLRKDVPLQEQEGQKERDGEEISHPIRVYTPGKNTIPLVCGFLGARPQDSIKTMVYLKAGENRPVLVVIRGDLDVNERKLANLLRTSEVKMALPEEIEEFGLVQGYMSPAGLEDFTVVSDDSLTGERGYLAGANEKDYHLQNVVPGRDFRVDLRGDIAAAREGDPCPVCGHPLDVRRGIEVGNTFMLGTKYSASMGATFRDEGGVLKPIVMGCYGMGVGRLLACVIQENRDERGIIWPATVAPYDCHLVSLGVSGEVREAAETIYEKITSMGLEVLYDDRNESAGVKFNDADLLGMPIRVTISERNLKMGAAEINLRREKEAEIVPLDQVPEKVQDLHRKEIRRYLPE